MALTLTGAKVIAMCIQMTVLIVFSLLPIKVADLVYSKGEDGKTFLSCCRCFGGGALLGSYMLHMTPEIRYLLEQALLIPNDISYPIPELIAGVGFFFFLILEWFVTKVDNIATERAEKEQCTKEVDIEQIKVWLSYNSTPLHHCPGESSDGGVEDDSVMRLDLPGDNRNNSNHKDRVERDSKVSGTSTAYGGSQQDSIRTISTGFWSNASSAERKRRRPRRHSYHSGQLNRESTTSTLEIHSYHSGRLSVRTGTTAPPATESTVTGEPVVMRDKQRALASTPTSSNESHLTNPEAGTRSLILLIALSADGFFQGMAIGLQRTIPAVFSLLIAVVSHEFVVAFCLGLELVRSKPLRSVIVYSLGYGMTPAFGVSAGIAVYMLQGDADVGDVHLANGILQSIATGVFLYVAFIGILGEELTSHPTIWAILAVIGGYMVMAILSLFHFDDHHYEDDPYFTADPPVEQAFDS